MWDFRGGAREPLTVLTGLQRQLYLACDDVRSRDELTRVAGEAAGCPATADVVEHALAALLEGGLMVRDGNSFLSLAIPLGEHCPPDAVLDRFYTLVEQMAAAPDPVVVLAPEPVPVT